METTKKQIKALVIGAGGNRGAAGAGKLARIKKDYDWGAAISTGAIMIVPALLGEHALLKKEYTSVSPKDIFDFNPINKKGNFKLWWILLRLFLGKSTISTSNKMRKSIDRVYKENNLWERLKSSGKIAWVGVYDISNQKTFYVCSKHCTYDEWVDYVWASACEPPVMSIVKKNGREFVDGGVQELIPLEFMVKQGAKDIDVIAHRPKFLPSTLKGATKNLIQLAYRLIVAQRREISDNDLKAGKLSCYVNKVSYAIHYVHQGYGHNELIFDNKLMREWYESAYAEPLTPEIFVP